MSLTLPNFEALFSIPPTHRLLLVRSRGRGGPMRGEYWTYEEVDEEGNVIARYESYDEIVAEGLAQRGWRKYDASGQLVDVQTVCVSWIARTETLSAFAA